MEGFNLSFNPPRGKSVDAMSYLPPDYKVVDKWATAEEAAAGAKVENVCD